MAIPTRQAFTKRNRWAISHCCVCGKKIKRCECPAQCRIEGCDNLRLWPSLVCGAHFTSYAKPEPQGEDAATYLARQEAEGRFDPEPEPEPVYRPQINQPNSPLATALENMRRSAPEPELAESWVSELDRADTEPDPECKKEGTR